MVTVLTDAQKFRIATIVSNEKMAAFHTRQGNAGLAKQCEERAQRAWTRFAQEDELSVEEVEGLVWRAKRAR